VLCGSARKDLLEELIDLSTTAEKLHHRIRLNRGFRSDLYWWACFSSQMVSMMKNVVRRLSCAMKALLSLICSICAVWFI